MKNPYLNKQRVKMEPEGFKYCPKCNTLKTLDEFSRDKSARFGRACHCKTCVNAYHKSMFKNKDRAYKDKRNIECKEKARERKELAVAYKGGICFDCKKTYQNCVYDFHHLDPSTKDFNPSAGFRKPLKDMYEELDKCVMLCSNCHRIRHFSQEDN